MMLTDDNHIYDLSLMKAMLLCAYILPYSPSVSHNGSSIIDIPPSLLRWQTLALCLSSLRLPL